MEKQFWELDVKLNDKNQIDYHDDCSVTIVGFGEVKSGKYRDFQNISILDQNGKTVEGASVSYAKSDTHLVEDDLNTLMPCRIKVENGSGQYAINGKKITFAFGQRKKSGGGGGNNRSYDTSTSQASSDGSARGKVLHGVICAAISSGQISCKSTGDAQAIADVIMSG